MTARVNPHLLGFCCRYASNLSCVGCGDSENGEIMPKTIIEDKKQAVTIRFSGRMIERMKAKATDLGLQLGEYVRNVVLVDLGKQ